MISLNTLNRRKQTFRQKPIEYERLRETKKVVHKEDGNMEFVHTGWRNVYDEIQSYKDSCSIENIIKRCTNDPSVLTRVKGVYGDATRIPTNMADALALVNQAQSIYETQKAEGKTKAPDFQAFLKDFGTATGLAHFVAANKPAPAEKVPAAPASAPAAPTPAAPAVNFTEVTK